MYIYKWQGAIISVLLAAIFYIFPFYTFMSENDYVLEFVFSFAVGAIFPFIWNIPSGTTAEVRWMGKRIVDKGRGACVWEEGPCLIPSFPPFFRFLRLPPLWDLERKFSKEDLRAQKSKKIKLNLSREDVDYRVGIQTTFGKAMTWRLLGKILKILNPYNGDPRYFHQRAGFFWMVLVVIVGVASNYLQSFQSVEYYFPFTFVKVQLAKETKPTFPSDEAFKIYQGDTWMYEYVDGRKLYSYTDGSVGKIPALRIRESSCVAVPAGKRIAFLTEYPPKYAINMKSTVYYTKKEGALTIPEKLDFMAYWFLTLFYDLKQPEIEHFRLSSSWSVLHRDWGGIEQEEGVVAQAIPSKDLLMGLGGLVCF